MALKFKQGGASVSWAEPQFTVRSQSHVTIPHGSQLEVRKCRLIRGPTAPSLAPTAPSSAPTQPSFPYRLLALLGLADPK